MTLAAGGRLGRAALGLVALVIVAGAFVPSPQPEDPGQPGPDNRERFETTVALTMPEGESARTLTITDSTGRELAQLTQWVNGETAVVARRDGGTKVGLWIHNKGCSASFGGTERKTRIEMSPDGTTKSIGEIPRPKGIPEVSRGGRATDVPPLPDADAS
jgi:hypothetical protein